MSEVLAQTAEDIEYVKGDFVRYVGTEEQIYTNYQYHRLNPEVQYEITRVYKNKVEIRGEMETKDWSGSHWTKRTAKMSILKSNIAPWDGPRPRRLGEKPEGDFIDANDPRVRWIFEDAAKLATISGHCREYDRIADQLGVPGRLRTFKVTTRVNGLNVTTSVRAHARTEAEQMVRDALGVEEASGDAED